LNNNIELLKIRTLIRIPLDQPKSALNNQKNKLYGSFRASDMRYEDELRKVEDYIIKPEHPVLYKISGIKNTYYTKNQLMLYDKKKEKIPEKVIKKFVIEKLIKRFKKNINITLL
jgi:hypothetical protein